MDPTEALSPRDVLGPRIAALVLDLAVILLAAGPLGGAAGWATAALFALVYGTVAGITGYSCGKALLQVKVVRAGTVEAPGAAKGLLRTLIGLVEVTLVPVAAIAVGTDGRRRRLGDRAAGTEVIGLAPERRVTRAALLIYVLLLALFLGLTAFNALLIVGALTVPVALAFIAVVAGTRREGAALPWLAVAAFTLIPSAYMTLNGLCARGSGTCVDVATTRAHGLPPLIAAVLALAAFFLLAPRFRRAVLAGLSIVAGVLVVRALRVEPSMTAAIWIVVLLLVAGVAAELRRFIVSRRSEHAQATAA